MHENKKISWPVQTSVGRRPPNGRTDKSTPNRIMLRVNCCLQLILSSYVDYDQRHCHKIRRGYSI